MSHLIELKDITKKYMMGNTEVSAVNGVSLTIDAGEFVAIMGASGSGKSTMLNILGFLDVPTAGSYKIMGKDVTGFDEDELSILRNHIAGFIFQQFQLLPRLSATDNVLLPTLYAGRRDMEERALEKLQWVGLGHRDRHYPNELSGGEQQRVAIARSMINEPVIIFADEPTGNLDTRSEAEIIAILERLNSQGKTIIMVTHENEVAAHADRIIRMKDGVIIADERRVIRKAAPLSRTDSEKISGAMERNAGNFGRAEFIDYIRQALGSLVSHKMRALLSMLGILIGVAAVISMLAIGEGAKSSIEDNLKNLGTNVLNVRPGFRHSGGVSLQQGEGSRLSMLDAESFTGIAGVKRVSPGVSSRAQAVYGSKNVNTQIVGAGVDYAEMKAAVPTIGRFFTEEENRSRTRVALVGNTVVKNLFGAEDPLGKKIKINKVSFTVIGVLPVKGAAMMRDQDDIIIIPVRTAMYRLLGKTYIDEINVEMISAETAEEVQESIKTLLRKNHRILPGQESLFEIMDFAEMRKTLMQTADTMSLLLGAVAAISLIVGGVGVMNIMLVSVKERTREIGLRKAIGGRRRDILLQFLVEAVMMTFVGGLTGITIGTSVSLAFSALAGWAVKISLVSSLGAAFFSILIGVIFGIWPATQASKLSPIEALRYE
jgi:macrolide transport system ATP-binding/permease protein